MTSKRIAIIGECMVELRSLGETLAKNFGGDTLNTALYLSRLSQDELLSTSYVTALGVDDFSVNMKAQWEKEGINTDFVLQIEDKQPGLYYIETDETGERTFYYWRNDAAAKYLFEQPQSEALINSLLSFDYLYLSGISLAILTEKSREQLFNMLEQAKRNGAKVIFDNNFRPKLWSSKEQALAAYHKMMSLTDIACLTFEDEQLLYGDTDVEQCIDRTQSAGVSEIVVKLGAEPCLIVTGQERISVAATKVDKVVDTTAAGDSFSAGYLAKRLIGGTAEQAAQSGHKLAGTVIQYPGAVIPLDAMPKFD